MLAIRPILARSGLALAVLSAASTLSRGDVSTSSSLALVDRTIAQDQGHWQVDYRLRHDGATGLIVTPAEISAKVEGWVSNSRVADHASPRRSILVVSGLAGMSATADVIATADDARRCRERAVLQVWDGRDKEPPAEPSPKAEPRASGPREVPILSLAPGATVRVRLRLEHDHFLYGPYDPLLGPRSLELRLASATLRDTLPLDRERYVAQAPTSWPAPPAERLDTSHFVSPPDSLHLEAHVPGNHRYGFPERPVRYDTKMRLRYWYLIAPGTRGDCRARISQYREGPSTWKVLSDGTLEETLAVVGRWVRVERTFRTEPDATDLSLDFRIIGAENIGEVWIDDVSLEAVADRRSGP